MIHDPERVGLALHENGHLHWLDPTGTWRQLDTNTSIRHETPPDPRGIAW